MAFKDNETDWANEGGSSARSLPAGGYVAVITAYEDREASNGNDYIVFTYDIAEGEYKGMFADADSWKHSFKRWYIGDRNKKEFAGFLRDIEASNNDFKVASFGRDLGKLVGKKVGIVVQRRDYTGRDGADHWEMEVRYCASADDIRNGRFSVPEPKDEREHKPEATHAAGGSVYDADLPF